MDKWSYYFFAPYYCGMMQYFLFVFSVELLHLGYQPDRVTGAKGRVAQGLEGLSVTGDVSLFVEVLVTD